MALLNAFEGFGYPNEMGAGMHDIHSPTIPTVDEMVDLITKASQKVAVKHLWVNPDCGLTTRTRDEVEPVLRNMIEAIKVLRRRC
jgi:5-methyltetrahydropteroyltriglutamate--homocysteine methyltransferase